MKTNEAPENIYIFENPILDFSKLSQRQSKDDIEYIRKDVFVEKACQYLYEYNQNMAKKYGAKAVLGCSEFTINVGDFKKAMKL